MKKRFFLFFILSLLLLLTACGDAGAGVSEPSGAEDRQSGDTLAEADPLDPGSEEGAVLVAYFSCTGNTKAVAEYAAETLHADLYEIVPQEPYTAADLNYNNRESRAAREKNDPSCRPAVAGGVNGMERYDTVLLGYPIWWGQAPQIISTFLESYDFSGKTIVPFCTSGSSGIGSSAENLRGLCSSEAVWHEGKRFGGGVSELEVQEWAAGLKPQDKTQEKNTMKITVGDVVFQANLEDNSSAEALRNLLANGPLTVQMHDYGNFEKVGELGQSLPANDEQITTGPGDLILYQGSRFVIYYDTNTWNFTRLGKIENATKERLLEALGDGDVRVTLSL